MYFWTNTPNQIAFTDAAARVNRFYAFIEDPNVIDTTADAYRKDLLDAQIDLGISWNAVFEDWQAWLTQNNFGFPNFGVGKSIVVPLIDHPGQGLFIPVFEFKYLPNGTYFSWNDFARMLTFYALLGRAVASPSGEAHRPKGF